MFGLSFVERSGGDRRVLKNEVCTVSYDDKKLVMKIILFIILYFRMSTYE